MTSLITVTDPYRPLASRQIQAVVANRTIYDHLHEQGYVVSDEHGIKRVGYFYVSVNGKAVLQRDWNTVVTETDSIAIWTLPQGGGGGGSNIGMILVTVVMVAAAVFTGGATLSVALMWGAAAGAGVGLLSMMVPKPETPPSQIGRESASPTYSISAQGNSARLMEAVPVQYGRMRVYPDLAAQPYTENNSNQVFVYQLFCLGQGDFDIEKINIEESDISSYGEVQYEVVRPGQKVTLFPDNVVTSDAVQGLELLGPNQEGYAVLGPYITAPPGTKTNFISVDIQLPAGAYTINDDGSMTSSSASFTIEYQEVTDEGIPTGQVKVLISQSLTYSTQTAQMLTFKVAVPEGRYQVSGYRTSQWSSDQRTVNKLVWSGLKAYLPSDLDYGNKTMLATIIRATNNLNQSTSRKINVICTRKLPTWDPVNGWSQEVATRNPAWAFADVLRNTDYGAGWGTNRMNIAELYRLSRVWDIRGDQFNGRFDTTITVWSALTQIAAVGRATPVYYAGIMDIVRDEPKTIPTQVFTPANILENTFKISYKLGTSSTPDYVISEFYDETVWQDDEVDCILPNSTQTNPSRSELFGCTNRDQAYREGMYKAAVNRDQRSRYSFTTEMEGLLLLFGDLIHVSHDVPAWGASGQVIGLNRLTGKITTSEPLIFTSAPVHQIALRKKNGKADGPYTIVPDPNAQAGVNSAIIQTSQANLQAIFISDGIRSDLTQYVFGPANRQANRLIVLSAKPNAKGETALTCCEYVDSVHIADQGGDVPPPPPTSDLPGVVVGPIVAKVELILTTTVGKQQIVASPATGAIYYEFEAKSGNGNWQALQTTSDPFIFVYLDTGSWQVRVRAVGVIAGPWATWIGTIEATSLPLAKLSAFTATSQLFANKLDWSVDPTSVSIAKSIEIYRSDNNNLVNASKLVELPFPASTYTHAGLEPGQLVYYWARVIDGGGRIGPWRGPISQRTDATANNLLNALQGKVDESQLTQALVSKINSPDVDLTPVYAAISQESNAREQGDIASTNQANTALSKANDGYALAQDATTTIANTNGNLAAMRTIKTGITSNGKYYQSGIGVGTSNTGGVIQSEVTVAATNFYVIDPNNPTDPGKLLFAVTPNGVVMRNAFIDTAYIQQILVGMTITSIATVASGPNAGLPIKTDNYNTGSQTMRGVNITRVDSATGIKMTDVNTGVVFIEMGDF